MHCYLHKQKVDCTKRDKVLYIFGSVDLQNCSKLDDKICWVQTVTFTLLIVCFDALDETSVGTLSCNDVRNQRFQPNYPHHCQGQTDKVRIYK